MVWSDKSSYIFFSVLLVLYPFAKKSRIELQYSLKPMLARISGYALNANILSHFVST